MTPALGTGGETLCAPCVWDGWTLTRPVLREGRAFVRGSCRLHRSATHILALLLWKDGLYELQLEPEPSLSTHTFITHYRVSIYSSPSCGFTRSYLPSHFKSPLEAELSVIQTMYFGGDAVKVISFGRITLHWEPLCFCELRVWLCKQCIFPNLSFVLLNIRGIFEYITYSQIQRLHVLVILYYSICLLHYIFSKCILYHIYCIYLL